VIFIPRFEIHVYTLPKAPGQGLKKINPRPVKHADQSHGGTFFNVFITTEESSLLTQGVFL
jgi:hypothetical protein